MELRSIDGVFGASDENGDVSANFILDIGQSSKVRFQARVSFPEITLHSATEIEVGDALSEECLMYVFGHLGENRVLFAFCEERHICWDVNEAFLRVEAVKVAT